MSLLRTRPQPRAKPAAGPRSADDPLGWLIGRAAANAPPGPVREWLTLLADGDSSDGVPGAAASGSTSGTFARPAKGESS
jgi:hypothetical protein